MNNTPKDTRRLYAVSVEVRELVLAESAEAAKQVFNRNLSEIAGCHAEHGMSVRLSNVATYHSSDSLIYHDGEGDITLEAARKIDAENAKPVVQVDAGDVK